MAVAPPTPISPASSQDGVSVARPPHNLPSHSSSPPKGSVSLIQCQIIIYSISKGAICLGIGTRETNHHFPPATPPLTSMHQAIHIPPQQRQRPHSNGTELNHLMM
jgi:hypothetical protein